MTTTYDTTVTIQDDAAYDAERVLRSAWRRGAYPVDPVRIAHALGINVVDAYLDPDVAGALVKESGRDPVILVNGSDSGNRKRFTIAHELGHFVKRADADYEYVDRRDTLSSTGHDPDEVYANAFAGNLLMPGDAVADLVKEGAGDLEMAIRFGVSREALNVRLRVLGLTPAL